VLNFKNRGIHIDEAEVPFWGLLVNRRWNMINGSKWDGYVLLVAGIGLLLGLISIVQYINLGTEIIVGAITLFVIKKIMES
jgi:hypothetical protein